MPWTPLHSQLHQCRIDRQLLPIGANILLAVSGGTVNCQLLTDALDTFT